MAPRVVLRTQPYMVIKLKKKKLRKTTQCPENSGFFHTTAQYILIYWAVINTYFDNNPSIKI